MTPSSAAQPRPRRAPAPDFLRPAAPGERDLFLRGIGRTGLVHRGQSLAQVQQSRRVRHAGQVGQQKADTGVVTATDRLHNVLRPVGPFSAAAPGLRRPGRPGASFLFFRQDAVGCVVRAGQAVPGHREAVPGRGNCARLGCGPSSAGPVQSPKRLSVPGPGAPRTPGPLVRCGGIGIIRCRLRSALLASLLGQSLGHQQRVSRPYVVSGMSEPLSEAWCRSVPPRRARAPGRVDTAARVRRR